MAARSAARDVAQHRGPGEVWINQAALSDSDLDWLGDVEHLTLYNVTAPDGFLARLPKLWLLDIRGGSAQDLARIKDCNSLRGLAVNQVRGLADLSQIATLPRLEFLKLYGLKQVSTLPSLAPMTSLRRVDIGRMVGVGGIDGLLDAPHLEELLIVGRVAVTEDDVERICGHHSLQSFDWADSTGDGPSRLRRSVNARVNLPRARSLFPRDWFFPDEAKSRRRFPPGYSYLATLEGVLEHAARPPVSNGPRVHSRRTSE